MNVSTEITLTPDSMAPNIEYKAFLILTLCLVIVIGSSGNLLLVFIVKRHAAMKSTINILLSTVALTDALTCMLCAPLDLMTATTDNWIFGETVCRIHAFTLSFLIVLNVIILILITLDRYFIIVRRKDRLGKCRVRLLIASSVFFSLVVCIPPLLGIGRHIFSNPFCSQLDHSSTLYSITFACILLLLPCGILFLTYVHIVIKTRSTSRRVQPEICTSFSPLSLHWIDLRFKTRNFSTVLCLYFVAVACKSPMAVTLLVFRINGNDAMFQARLCCVCLAYINCAINPLIYACKISRYWRALTRKARQTRSSVRDFQLHRMRVNPERIYQVSTDHMLSQH